MDSKPQPGLMLYRETLALLAMADDATASAVIKAAAAYFLFDREPDELDDMSLIIWQKAKFDIDSSAEKYTKTCARNRSNIGKRYHSSTTGKPLVDHSNTSGIPTPNTKLQTPNDNIEQETSSESNHTRNCASEPRRARFAPPSEKDLVDYFTANGSTEQEARRFLDHYTANGWLVGKNPMRDWKAAVRGWISRAKDYAASGAAASQHSAAQSGRRAGIRDITRSDTERAAAGDWLKNAGKRRIKKAEKNE